MNQFLQLKTDFDKNIRKEIDSSWKEVDSFQFGSYFLMDIFQQLILDLILKIPTIWEIAAVCTIRIYIKFSDPVTWNHTFKTLNLNHEIQFLRAFVSPKNILMANGTISDSKCNESLQSYSLWEDTINFIIISQNGSRPIFMINASYLTQLIFFFKYPKKMTTLQKILPEFIKCNSAMGLSTTYSMKQDFIVVEKKNSFLEINDN